MTVDSGIEPFGYRVVDDVLKPTLKILSPVKAIPSSKMGIDRHLIVSLGKKLRVCWTGVKSTPARRREVSVVKRRERFGGMGFHT